MVRGMAERAGILSVAAAMTHPRRHPCIATAVAFGKNGCHGSSVSFTRRAGSYTQHAVRRLKHADDSLGGSS